MKGMILRGLLALIIAVVAIFSGWQPTIDQGKIVLTVGMASAAGDPDYTTDGTDDQVQIKQAINALPSTGGKVQLLGGTYDISATINITDKFISIAGTGHGVLGGTKLDAAANLTGCMIECTENAGNAGLFLSDMTLDGNSVASVNGVYLHDVHDCHVYRCFIEYFGGAGIYLGESGGATGSGNIWISDCWIEFNVGNGIHSEGNGNVRIQGNLIFRNHGSNIYITKYGYYSVSERYIIEGNTIYQAYNHGFHSYRNPGTIIVNDNSIISNSYSNAGLYDGIHIGGSTSNGELIVVGNNIVDQATSGKTQRYAIYFESATANCTIIANKLNANQTGSIYLPAGYNTGGIVANNIGYVTENHGASVGTGAEQTIAHGLSFTPSIEQVGVFSDNATAFVYQSTAPDATNIYVTCNETGSSWHWATIGN